MNLIKRLKEPTPKFFKKLRALGILLATAGGAILASPVSLPIIIVNIAGYVTLAGGVMTAVSQTAIKSEPEEQDDDWPIPDFKQKKDGS
jgi:uncharacterized membrane protein HdeD (DUF308 family)